jgi:antitoxin ParD1/3/4
MTITLPDSMRAEVEEKAKAAGFASVDAYVASLIVADKPDESGESDVPEPPPGAGYVVNSREELEAKLLEGLDSGPPIPVTPEFWSDLQKRVEERAAAKRGQPG